MQSKVDHHFDNFPNYGVIKWNSNKNISILPKAEIMATKLKTKSPLKSEPMHNPGQSLGEQIQDLLSDKVLLTILYPLVFATIAFFEWRWYLHPSIYPPYISTLAAIIFLIIALIRLPKYWKEIKQLRQGQKGEIAVGQYLNDLHKDGFEIFHDIVGDGFNVDHVIITEHGIFVIETKTWSKPENGKAVINWTGNNISVNGMIPDRNPVRQVKLLAQWITEVLKDSSGHDFPVKGVVVFPGWFIDPACNTSQSDIWILNPKSLHKFIKNEAIRLPPDMVKMASKHIKSFVRSQSKKG